MYYKMPKFDIYLIWGKDCDGNILRYYGSTSNFIKRKSYHKNNYLRWVNNGRPKKKCSSFIILDNGDWKMEKIDEIEGEKWEARKLEGEYQKNNDCINVQIASRTPKEYYDENKVIIAQKNKVYRLAHMNKIKNKKKEYHLAHRDEILKKNNEYYKANKEAIIKKSKEKITCECGSEVRKDFLNKHRKTNKHINFINSANND